MRLRNRSGLSLAMLLVALLPGVAPGAEDREVAADEAKPTQSKAEPDRRASSATEDLMIGDGPPPGTCPVTEEIVDTYCKDHSDDAGCRAHRGQ